MTFQYSRPDAFIEETIKTDKKYQKRITIEQQKYTFYDSQFTDRAMLDNNWCLDGGTTYQIQKYLIVNGMDGVSLKHRNKNLYVDIPLIYIKPYKLLTELDHLLFGSYHFKCVFPTCKKYYDLIENKLSCNKHPDYFSLEYENGAACIKFSYGNEYTFSYACHSNTIKKTWFKATGTTTDYDYSKSFEDFYKLIIRTNNLKAAW